MYDIQEEKFAVDDMDEVDVVDERVKTILANKTKSDRFQVQRKENRCYFTQ